jgi:hypothetical protein
MQKYPSKVRISFNAMGEDGESGEMLVNDGAKHQLCSRWGRTNHTLDKYISRKHSNITMLHNMGEIDKVEYEMNNEVGT